MKENQEENHHVEGSRLKKTQSYCCVSRVLRFPTSASQFQLRLAGPRAANLLRAVTLVAAELGGGVETIPEVVGFGLANQRLKKTCAGACWSDPSPLHWGRGGAKCAP